MRALLSLSVVFGFLSFVPTTPAEHSVARKWNEVLLDAIRNDFARPTVHARNLFHTSVAVYDAWAVYDSEARPYLLGNTVGGFTCLFDGVPVPLNSHAAQEEAISYASFRILTHRFQFSPGAAESLPSFVALMEELGYDPLVTFTDYAGGSPAALGNYIGQCIIEFGLQDGANEQGSYENLHYFPVNPSLVPFVPGNPNIIDPNRWQPLTLEVFIDQGGNVIPINSPPFLSPEWGIVTPFSLTTENLTTYSRNGNAYPVYHDPGPPPYLDVSTGGGLSDEYKWGFAMVSIWSSHMDPSDGVEIDISPASFGNMPFESLPESFEDYPDYYRYLEGGDIGEGHDENPYTGLPYEPQVVPRGDYTRVLAEFWADGPDSETPPGHWFTILNYVNDHPLFEKRFEGVGEILDDLEWDTKSNFILAGAMHDVAVSAWGIKGWYDYIRPISALRLMADLGQCTDPGLLNYHLGGIPLVPGYIEVIQPGDPLAGFYGLNVGKIKIYAWLGPEFISNPANDVAGVGWILASNWWPYQRPSFVTPPFAGYVSGHSTYSRAAAELIARLTGDPFFPGGLGEFHAPQNEFLVFEDGPSVDITLQWATYADASDQTSLSRIWGGIHPPADDIPGRIIGKKIGISAFEKALCYFSGPEAVCADLVLEPDGNGNYLVSADSVDDGSFHPCSTITLAVDPELIPCKHDAYMQEVSLIVTDEFGRQSSCTANVTLLQDEDQDGVGDACDACPGFNDQVDGNNDGLPDCANFPGVNAPLPPEWQCNNGEKVHVTVYPLGRERMGSVLCVEPIDAGVLMQNGAYLGIPIAYGGGVRIRTHESIEFLAVFGHRYRCQYSTDLGEWVDMEPIICGNGRPTQISDSNQTETVKFYRVVELP